MPEDPRWPRGKIKRPREGILVGREVKESARDPRWPRGKRKRPGKGDPRWPRGKIKRPGEMLVGREIKESAYIRSLKVQFFTGCARQHFIFTAALLKRPMISSLWMIRWCWKMRETKRGSNVTGLGPDCVPGSWPELTLAALQFRQEPPFPVNKKKI